MVCVVFFMVICTPSTLPSWSTLNPLVSPTWYPLTWPHTWVYLHLVGNVRLTQASPSALFPQAGCSFVSLEFLRPLGQRAAGSVMSMWAIRLQLVLYMLHFVNALCTSINKEVQFCTNDSEQGVPGAPGTPLRPGSPATPTTAMFNGSEGPNVFCVTAHWGLHCPSERAWLVQH